jgi:NTE family protein
MDAIHENTSNKIHTRPLAPSGPVAVVLAGAGARGAYEAAYIATMLPHLQPRPTIFVGTSAGAINAALLASVADATPEKARDEIIMRWGMITKKRVMEPLWRSLPRAIFQYASAVALGTNSPHSLLDTTPLAHSLKDRELVDWDRIRNNIASAKVDTLAVVATEAGSGRTRVFYERASKLTKIDGSARAPQVALAGSMSKMQSDADQAIDYVCGQLEAEHVRASAAIPVFFPPVSLPIGSREAFFLDGGVRLNAPLKPAIALGAKGLIVISTDPRRHGASDAIAGSKSPSMQDQVLEIMRGVSADRMIEDVRVLLNRNRAVLEARDGVGDDRYIPLIFGGPQDQDRVGSVAARAVREILRGPDLLQVLKNLDLWAMDRLTSVSSASGPDILSYLLFEPEFISEALKAGTQDAEALLNDYPDPADLWDSLRSREIRRDSMTGRKAA